jgi:hypothetical protein
MARWLIFFSFSSSARLGTRPILSAHSLIKLIMSCFAIPATFVWSSFMLVFSLENKKATAGGCWFGF